MSAIPSQVDPHSAAGVFPAAAPSADIAPTNARKWTAREWRVAFLLAIVVLVSLADLYLTLTYLNNGGMAEGNPVARWVMSLGCPWVLGLWKVCLVGLTCAILYTFRKRASAELGAWVCCAAMAWLCFQWSIYVQDIGREMNANPTLTQASTWVSFERN